ncbi:neurogenic protein mastermind isoform X1 [Drosophila gunungcola]|uniref:neurogenic protein mastermind isoform X1 n=1 Tax=Drosophila gunungcola TaxID=103775 RepID=UPI0022E73D33|nr:neurogenic protein mastermind isoform X1 [Drosophila gunungcola]
MFAVALTMAALVLAGQQEVCRAQVSIHTDANTNSYSLKTPGLQQTFTRYYGGAAKAAQPQNPSQEEQPQGQEQLQNAAQFGGFSPSGQQYPAVYAQPGLRAGGRLKATPISLLQQQQQQLLAQQQHQLLAAAAPQGAVPVAGAGPGSGGVANIPSYADQMHAAFLDYQRQRTEFEQQQQQLLQKLYHYYPDVSGSSSLNPAQIQTQPQPQPQPQLQPQPQSPPSDGAGVGVAASRFAYRRPQFGSNGLQPGQPGPSGISVGPPAASPGPLRHVATGAGAGDFYSTQQHMGFMQQQQQDILRDQQQSVAQQFATSQLAPTTRQSYGMAVPMSSVLDSPAYQQSPDVSHVSFSSGNLNYSF